MQSILNGRKRKRCDRHSTLREMFKTSKLRVQVTQKPLVSRTDEKTTNSPARSAGKDVYISLPPAVKDLALSAPSSVLLGTSSRADTGLCKCVSGCACRTATRLSICRQITTPIVVRLSVRLCFPCHPQGLCPCDWCSAGEC